ncbi:MAG: deoxyuridine 5'-triphosphate nucleotidohydrolase [Clostridia bacterium]
MREVARFEKISYGQFEKDYKEQYPSMKSAEIKDIYDKIVLPARATKSSAGYDFYSPISFTLKPNETIKILSGIKCFILDNWMLSLYPKSGLGFKFRLQLNNTVGIIDADYYNNINNEGHIQFKLTNASNENKVVEINSGAGFAQGVFLEYGVVIGDVANKERVGGFGSTSK